MEGGAISGRGRERSSSGEAGRQALAADSPIAPSHQIVLFRQIDKRDRCFTRSCIASNAAFTIADVGAERSGPRQARRITFLSNNIIVSGSTAFLEPHCLGDRHIATSIGLQSTQ